MVDNRYTRTRPLGSGGMADVYLAHDEVLDRDVALKVLKDKYAKNEEFVERFKREARSAAALSHPNIVSVYDWGCSEDEMYYIAMEYVSGGTLKDRVLGEGALDPDAATKFASQIAQALGHAHEHGVIHRDIKSRNILLTETGYAKVADFGIARAATATTTSSRSSLVLGTPGYISPEQATGKPVGPRSDLYSFGVVLYEMLTGTLPYSGEGPASMAFQHVHGPLRSPREANPDIPEPLNALTTKLLAKDPEDRYASAVELADDLERVQSGLTPLRGATEKTTTEMITAPLLLSRDQRGQRMALQPPVAAPIMEVFKSGTRVRGRLLRTLAMVLCGVFLLGGLAWTLTQDQSTPGTSGSEEASFTEKEAAPTTVQEVPESYYDSVSEGTLGHAGLEVGDQNEASDAAVPTGYGIEQHSGVGTTADEGTAVDVAVSTGSQQPPATQAAAPSAANPKQAPTAVRAAPEAAPTSVDADPPQEARAARASSTTSQTASTSPVSDKTEKKGKKTEKKRKT
jgi:tRNA A-37 threonylcarbamoyl transferase component Bud32